MERVLFARVAWMDRYAGVMEEDPWASGSGWVQEGGVPWECCNFLGVRGYYYGYSRPAFHADRARLDRIDPSGNGRELTGVRVIFFAPAPHGAGQRIVGWYANATVVARARRDVRERVDDSGERLYWFFKCPTSEGTLLPVAERTFEIPRGKGGTGQSNWTFPLDVDLRPKDSAWMTEAVAYTKRIEARTEHATTSTDMPGSGQGIVTDALARSAIELRAMEVVRADYAARGFEIEDTHQRECFDFRCSKAGREVRVEVKGTSSKGASVRLTSAEVEGALKEGVRTDLAIVAGIAVRSDGARPVASGGQLRVLEDWRPRPSDLRPTEYEYRVPGGT